jgi:hypothetical protein
MSDFGPNDVESLGVSALSTFEGDLDVGESGPHQPRLSVIERTSPLGTTGGATVHTRSSLAILIYRSHQHKAMTQSTGLCMYHVALFIRLANIEDSRGISRADMFSLRQRDISQSANGIERLSVVP